LSEVLSQEEVDALLRGIGGGDIDVETDAGGEPGGTVLYDFANQDRVIRGRMPTLEIVHDRFARNLQGAITNSLRRAVDVSMIQSDMAKFGDFMRGLPLPTSLHLFKMEPLRGYGLMVLEGKLVFAFVDAFFGGNGVSHVKMEGRDFTVIEQRLIRKVVDMALTEYERSWRSVEPLKITNVRSEVNPQFVNIVPPSDVVVTVKLEMEFEETTGIISFCIPYSTLEPIKDRLRAGFQNETVSQDSGWLERLQAQLGDVEVEVGVTLGGTEITGRDMLRLKEGDVIVLDQDSDHPAEITVENIPKLLGRVGVHKGKRAVQVEDFQRRKK
jgi:flagellar motor switch protein FliM